MVKVPYQQIKMTKKYTYGLLPSNHRFYLQEHSLLLCLIVLKSRYKKRMIKSRQINKNNPNVLGYIFSVVLLDKMLS